MKTLPPAKPAKSRKAVTPEFVKRAERAFKTVAREVRAEAKRHGLKPLEWAS